VSKLNGTIYAVLLAFAEVVFSSEGLMAARTERLVAILFARNDGQ